MFCVFVMFVMLMHVCGELRLRSMHCVLFVVLRPAKISGAASPRFYPRLLVT